MHCNQSFYESIIISPQSDSVITFLTVGRHGVSHTGYWTPLGNGGLMEKYLKGRRETPKSDDWHVLEGN